MSNVKNSREKLNSVKKKDNENREGLMSMGRKKTFEDIMKLNMKVQLQVMKDFYRELSAAEGGVSDPMAEYEEFVMLAYSSSQSSDRERFSKVTAAPSGNIDLRLEAVKADRRYLFPEEIVAAARYCGFWGKGGLRAGISGNSPKTARQGSGRESPQMGRGVHHGAGWIVFETDPRYPMPQLKLPYGDEGGIKGGKCAAGGKTWENALRPCSVAPSQRSVSQDKKTDPAVPRSVWAIPAAAVLGRCICLFAE